MTTSINIVDIVGENVAVINIATIPVTHPTFLSSEMWLQNLQDDAGYPLVFLERPITEQGKVLPQGNPQSTYDLNVWLFAGTTRQDSPQSEIEPLLSTSKDMKRQLVILLQRDRRIERINSYSVEEISQTQNLDINPCGVWLKINLTVIDPLTVC